MSAQSEKLCLPRDSRDSTPFVRSATDAKFNFPEDEENRALEKFYGERGLLSRDFHLKRDKNKF